MSNGDNLSSHVVVESVDAVCVDETVSHPQTGLHHLLYLSYHLQ